MGLHQPESQGVQAFCGPHHQSPPAPTWRPHHERHKPSLS